MSEDLSLCICIFDLPPRFYVEIPPKAEKRGTKGMK